ncbi:MAG TPA: carboxypeptidase-like regulatory domain-containing protein, partial [Candidatus Marinimicrobia bacterium]|nr:carboxypeptidase-like regulatory domain-containing protein [Candidatus Neomarinimicrobiota bacterium]
MISENGRGVKKARVILMDPNGIKVKGGKTNKKGEFVLKKLDPGFYTLQAIHKTLGTGTAAITV